MTGSGIPIGGSTPAAETSTPANPAEAGAEEKPGILNKGALAVMGLLGAALLLMGGGEMLPMLIGGLLLAVALVGMVGTDKVGSFFTGLFDKAKERMVGVEITRTQEPEKVKMTEKELAFEEFAVAHASELTDESKKKANELLAAMRAGEDGKNASIAPEKIDAFIPGLPEGLRSEAKTKLQAITP